MWQIVVSCCCFCYCWKNNNFHHTYVCVHTGISEENLQWKSQTRWNTAIIMLWNGENQSSLSHRTWFWQRNLFHMNLWKKSYANYKKSVFLLTICEPYLTKQLRPNDICLHTNLVARLVALVDAQCVFVSGHTDTYTDIKPPFARSFAWWTNQSRTFWSRKQKCDFLVCFRLLNHRIKTIVSLKIFDV